MSDSTKQTLADVKVGHDAIVKQVSGERRDACRLLEMGLLPGTKVEVVRIAPMGDPMMLRLRDYNLSIRREDAALIAVEPGAKT